MGTIITFEVERKLDGTVKVGWAPLTPLHIIHDKVNQNLCSTRQGEARNTAQPDTGVNNVPDQFRIIAASQGGGDERDSLDTLDTTSQTSFAVDTGCGIALKPNLGQTDERTKEDDRTCRNRGLTSNFQEKVN